MAGYDPNNWHNANGGGLPFRPPTVDEALPYSPFTSVVPFSPDIIPYPITEPPTPPTTLSPEQRNAAKRAVGILNEEIKGPTSTAQHLEDTFRELRSLLGNPQEMTQFRFKPVSQLATPPPESPTDQTNGATPTKTSALSPFARMLLKQTNVDYLPAGAPSVQRPKVTGNLSEHASPQVSSREPPQPVFSTPNRAPHAQNGVHQHPPSTPASSTSSQQPRSGPTVVINPLGPSARREEYRRYDQITDTKGSAQQKRVDRQEQESMLATLRPQERELAEQKIEQLHRFTKKLQQEKEDADESENFKKVSCLDADITVMRTDTLDRLYDRTMVVEATSCFSSVSVDAILRIHALCEPSIAAFDQSSPFSQSDLESWPNDLHMALSALKAARLALTAMLEGCDDRRVTPEDMIITIIEALKRVLLSCVFPVLESRRTGEKAELFNFVSGLKDKMRSTILQCTSVLKLLAPLVGKVTLTHNAINPIEYLALALLVQQNSDSDKDSVFGIQKFESLRQAAIEVLTQVFAAHSDHQHSITSEILNNLEKLPDKGANARQFKSVRDPPIMSVSALFLRFVQVAATNQHNPHKKAAAPIQEHESADEDGSDYDSDEPAARKKRPKPIGDNSARSIALRMTESAMGIAARIASVLSERAMNVSKSGDKPFRNLLDMFVEDFCNVLGSPEWPAAAVLLQQLLRCMIRILKTDKNNKDMALTIMGSMGCGIIDFKLRVKRLKRELDISQSDLSSKLDRLAEDALDNDIHKKDLLGFKGPYRMVIESLPDYLRVEANQSDPHLRSVQGCYMSFWLNAVAQALEPTDNGNAQPDEAMAGLQSRLETMFMDPATLSREYKFQTVSEMQCRLAAGVITLQDAFCQFFKTLINTMIGYTRENAATLKSRAIKNIESFLDKDAQTIPQDLVMGVIGLLRDNSPLVRADAVSLVSKCLEGNPDLEKHCIGGILHLTTDPSNGPKKKAINLLKKMYQSSSSSDHKLSIVASLLLPSQDHEKAIADMSRQALEDIWLKSLAADAKADENKLKFRRIERASLLVQTVRLIQGQAIHVEAFEKFFAAALARQSLNVAANTHICEDLVADMVEGVISPDSMAAGCSQEHVLQALSIFARIRPGLFSADQLQLLKIYVKDPATTDDLNILRPTVTIFRFVLPQLPNLQADFAFAVWRLLSLVISRLAGLAGRGNPAGKCTLQDVVHCMWMISPLINPSTKAGISRMIHLVTSTLCPLPLFNSATEEEIAKTKSKNLSYIILVGTFGKICNFDKEDADAFRASIAAKAKAFIDKGKIDDRCLQSLLKPGRTAPSLIMLETVRPFTKGSWDLNIREHALCSVAEICQGSPDLFGREEVGETFKQTFENDVESLKRITLTHFHDFFVGAERQSDGDQLSQDVTESQPRLGTSFVAGEDQVMTNFLARKFFPNIVHVALTANEELALIATNIIASVSRQGLEHPKICGAPLIALGTSPNAQIAQTASIQHKKIHDAHESMFEKEYMAAIRTALKYQQDVYKDPHGMIASTYKPKMLQIFSVLKGGNRKTLKKFLDNICKEINFDLRNLEGPEVGNEAVLYARFVLENLALFDVPKLEDVAIIINALENIVMKLTGPSVGVAIETEMPKADTPKPLPEEQAGSTNDGLPAPSPAVQMPQESLGEERLLQLTQACMILQMMWETRGFIRRAYNLHNTTGRIQHKDYQKPALRNNLISGKDLWERLDLITNSIDSQEAMVKRCHDFLGLLEVDDDVQFGNEEGEEEEGAERYTTPDEAAEGVSAVPTSGRGRKRKSSSSLANTPKKARGRPSGSKGKKQRNSKTPDLEGRD
ncbi:sister chromatid cohesion protein-like protein Mis4 [Byssothecium circinans]|uniref:Sister chromatid cohesion protein n=1 Tax=Byssothecium circinans TaxID=147558 RepID=A0A6A5TS75_9PLEO|nr:sister chromatid cohesion protein-like protein Mis4 [Byssothecium circinans]